MSSLQLKDYIEAARALHECKLDRSAKALLDRAAEKFSQRWSPEDKNFIRDISKYAKIQRPRIENGVYALAVFDTEVGILVPLYPQKGTRLSSTDCDQEAMEAWEQARNRRRNKRIDDSHEQHSQVPEPPLLIPEGLSLQGSSCGLPSALAIEAMMIGRLPPMPVVATGHLHENDEVDEAGSIEEKLSAGVEELKGGKGIILIPYNCIYRDDSEGKIQKVRNLEDAFELAFPKTKRTYRKIALALGIFLLAIIILIGGKLIIKENRLSTVQKEVVSVLAQYYGLYGSNDEDKYWSMHTDPLECFYNGMSWPLSKVKERRKPGFLPDLRRERMWFQFVEAASDRVVVSIYSEKKLNEDPTRYSRYGHILILKKVDGIWKIAGEAGRSKHNCLEPADAYERPANPSGWQELK